MVAWWLIDYDAEKLSDEKKQGRCPMSGTPKLWIVIVMEQAFGPFMIRMVTAIINKDMTDCWPSFLLVWFLICNIWVIHIIGFHALMSAKKKNHKFTKSSQNRSFNVLRVVVTIATTFKLCWLLSNNTWKVQTKKVVVDQQGQVSILYFPDFRCLQVRWSGEMESNWMGPPRWGQIVS